ncbi:hypothetical protein MRQ36_01915 [Micromonospora sp. R77]|uniref:hypothetical protein n=1 Tax=Micromonospora sp. R77 TaxID=2925836 RepID=UPI001F623D64|nr:hypothetical protein [Micromonospora sp. R77]MCI4061397.1 hypothetical protein [Micromonospora sp. R77]
MSTPESVDGIPLAQASPVVIYPAEPAEPDAAQFSPVEPAFVRSARGDKVIQDPDGGVVRQELADGGVYDRFDNEGRPIHGVVDGQGMDISYAPDGSSVLSYAGGDKVMLDPDGGVVRQATADGGVFDRFDGGGRPTHGVVDGQPVDVVYGGDGGSTWRYGDGTSVSRDADGGVVRQELPDGGVYDRFDGEDRPTHGVVDGRNVDIRYAANGGSVQSYAGGETVTLDANGDVVRQELPDGVGFYDRFDGEGRPVHGVIDGQSVDIRYAADGGSVLSYAGGETVTLSPDGSVVRQELPDGVGFYDRFDGEDRPTHGVVDGRNVDIRYAADGGSVQSYAGGETVTLSPDGSVVRQELPDGVGFYDRFDGEDRPTHGVVDGRNVDITYAPDGGSVQSYAGGEKVTLNPDGSIARQELPNGAGFYDQFDGEDRPVHGVIDGRNVDITYAPDGSSVQSYEDDGTKIYRDPDYNLTKQVLSDGTTYDTFDTKERPTHGVVPARDGRPAQQVSITYGPDGSSTSTFGDGAVVKRDGADNLTSMQSNGWTFDTFDAQDRPTAGTEDGTGRTVKVVYAKDGSSVWTYSDGNIVTRDAKGDLLNSQANGWTYDEFDSEARPTHGYDGDGNTVDIKYTADGLVESTFGNGTVVGSDSDGNPIYQIVNGERAEYAVEIPKLGAAIKKIEGERDAIEVALKILWAYFEDAVGSAWVSPSGTKYQELGKDMSKLTIDTKGLLDDAIRAMQKSYDTYVGAEGANTKNMTNAK